MRNSKINYLVVGVFVSGMLTALVVSIALLSGQTGPADNYYAYYSNVSGVKFGTQVVYEGFPIGQVEKVTPQEKDGRMQFRVDFGITENWRLPNDSVVEIAAPGLLAAVTLAIQAGSSPTPLKPGAQVPSKERSDVFAVVSSVAGQFGNLMDSNVKPLLTNVNKAVATINKVVELEGLSLFEDARKVTNDLSELVGLMARRVPKIADNIEEFSARLNVTADELQKLMTPGTREQIEGVIANLDKATVSMDALVNDLGGMAAGYDKDMTKTLSETRYVVESVSRHIDSINQNMEGAARNMYEFTRQIRQNPGLLLGGEAPEDKSNAQ
ncbi:MAG: MCE family protein [Alphaproteobacteria bacterium]|jgi:phospholipid/cholesterol/gamma-HCH transport system substrate-binding protein|nr:MCE family protein [Alphaproteobacteria bacterium]MBT7942665.1 MCE family protein [Alphaproteobacteria bacterium]